MSSVRKLATINQKTIIKKKYYRDSLGFKITIIYTNEYVLILDFKTSVEESSKANSLTVQ